MRKSRGIRAIAWAAVAAGVAGPLLRRRARIPPSAVLAATAAAPIGICIAVPRSPRRDVAACCLQMWAYLVAYKLPHDDPERLERRVRIDYPIRVDRVLGAGTLPTLRLQRRLAAPGEFSTFDKVLVWTHWMWFAVPHSAVAYMLVRRPERFPRAAAMTYAVFDLGLIGYWAVPTAPPWYAAERGRTDDGRTPAVRRMMVEYGERFWRRGWGPLYSVFGGNPLAAMPSLHFATSLMAAHLLAEAGPLEGAVGWAYAVTLGVALVHLGEHYVVDLIAGAALTEAVRAGEHRARPLLAAGARRVAALEALARA